MLQIQKKFNLDSYYVYPDSNTLLKNLDLVYHHQEEPFGSASILAQWEVIRLAKQNNVSVLLDGQGADEFLSGYHKYFPTYLFELAKQDKIKYNHQLTKINDLHNVNLTPTFKNRFLMNNKVLSKYLLKGKKRLTLNSKRGLNNEFYSTYKANENPFTSFDTLNEFLKYDTSIYGLEKLLRFCDRNSMAFSIEVRLPFLYHDLVEFVFSLPSEYKIHEGWSKFILRKSSESVLPKEITWRVDKMGYQAPQEDWRKKSLEIQEQINHYNMILVENNILKENSNIDYWQKLMVGKLLE